MSPTAKFLINDGNYNNNNNDKEDKWDKSGFPYEIRKVDEEINEELLRYFKGERSGFVQVGPKKWFFPSGFSENALNYYNFKIRPDDVFVITFPRSGTTWTQEMVWLISNDLNYKEAAEIPLVHRFPFLEFSSFVHEETKAQFLSEHQHDPQKLKEVDMIDYPGWKQLEETQGRRFIKTHLPFSLLPPNILETGCKVIYVARNPKDVAVSFYHLNRLVRTQGYVGDFPRYWTYFRDNLQPWTPYWDHIQEGWDRRHEPNMLFLFYEDINKDLRSGLLSISRFFAKCYTKEQLDGLERHLRIENFRNNKSVNYDILKELGVLKSGEEGFVRKGQNGGWRDYFKGELNEDADEWIEAHLKNTDLRFPNK